MNLSGFANYKPLVRCGMEELAARQRQIVPNGGILFARNADGEEKRAARQQVLDLFQPDRWPRPLHMLTMPGLQWRFERLLLGAREAGWFKAHSPRRTRFTSVENERSLYYAAVAQMPGVLTPDAVVKRVRTFSFAEHAVKTHYASFFFANVDNMMAIDGWTPWDAIWLDYTGPLTIERLALIAQFYDRYIHDTLIVTALKARWNDKTSAAINAAGGHSHWLQQHLTGEILHDIEYTDTSPMAQFAVRKKHGLWAWL